MEHVDGVSHHTFSEMNIRGGAHLAFMPDVLGNTLSVEAGYVHGDKTGEGLMR